MAQRQSSESSSTEPNAGRREPGTGMPAPIPVQVTPQRKAELEQNLNYPATPGRHTVRSPAAGSRSSELASLRAMASQNPAMLSFAAALYEPQNIHLIPASQARKAEAASLEIFRRYLSRYPGSGLTETNAVGWHSLDMTRTFIADVENNDNTWNVQPNVYDRTHMRGKMALPRFIAATHEFMHVEETPRGAARDWDRSPPKLEIVSELMPAIMTIVMVDEAYKRVNSIPLARAVNYGQTVRWGGHAVPLGRIANFYRSQIGRYGSIGAAVSSPESLEFMQQGAIPPRMVVPTRTP